VVILTAEFGELHGKTENGVQHFVIELAVLTVLIITLAILLVLLRKSGTPTVAQRGKGDVGAERNSDKTGTAKTVRDSL
jgi:hypothetical protein